jgi:BirA family transcriptional regulator, biotin operon repressor / biotin---[acetyl-CoA-carboxylase] ligase
VSAPATTSHPFISHLERFGSVPSTQSIVHGWLDQGVREVCVAVADEQTSGRGRRGRAWVAPPGAGLLTSAGFRPRGLLLRHAWRLPAAASMAMLDAAEEVAGLRDGALWLKWPNDIVAEGPDGALLKIAGVLGDTTAQGGSDGVMEAVVGVGINVDWPAGAFPEGLRGGMSSLRELAGGRPVDRDALLDAWLSRLEVRYAALLGGQFDAGTWSTRQLTTGRIVQLDLGDGWLSGRADGVDPEDGALLVRDGDGTIRRAGTGEVVRCQVFRAPGAAG